MPKLHQIVAVREGKKSRTMRAITEVNKRLQKPALFEGINRVYTPTAVADGETPETLPTEHKPVQFKVTDLFAEVRSALTELYDITLTQDVANSNATATVTIDGQPVLNNVPITTLIFLEKQLEDLRTIVSSAPTRDPGENWSHDETTDTYQSDEVVSNRTKKVPKVLVKYDATDKHPAQTERYDVDEKVGEWHARKYSGALSLTEKKETLARINKLQDAVKQARSAANEAEVEQQQIGNDVFNFVFGNNAE